MSRSFCTTLSAAILLVGTACYKVTVVTAPEPANARVVDKAWNNSFVYGIVPPSEINVSAQCRGVSRVVTQRSFLNGLVSNLTWGIYTPLQVTITCANGATASQPLGIPPERVGVLPSAPALAADSARPATH